MQRSAKLRCASVVGFSLLCPIAALVASAGQGERLMPYRASPPIAERLHPDDRVVIVSSGGQAVRFEELATIVRGVRE